MREAMLQDIPGVLTAMTDDLRVFVKTEEEHRRALLAVLQRLEERGLTLNLVSRPQKIESATNEDQELRQLRKLLVNGARYTPKELKFYKQIYNELSVTRERSHPKAKSAQSPRSRTRPRPGARGTAFDRSGTVTTQKR